MNLFFSDKLTKFKRTPLIQDVSKLKKQTTHNLDISDLLHNETEKELIYINFFQVMLCTVLLPVYAQQ